MEAEGALHVQVGPTPLFDLGSDLKMFPHLAGSGLQRKRLLAPVALHSPSQISELSSFEAKYLDTRKALSNWWGFFFFCLFHLRLFVSCRVA